MCVCVFKSFSRLIASSFCQVLMIVGVKLDADIPIFILMPEETRKRVQLGS